MMNEAFFATSIKYFSLDLTVYRKTNGNQIEEYRGFCSPNINISIYFFNFIKMNNGHVNQEKLKQKILWYRIKETLHLKLQKRRNNPQNIYKRNFSIFHCF